MKGGQVAQPSWDPTRMGGGRQGSNPNQGPSGCRAPVPLLLHTGACLFQAWLTVGVMWENGLLFPSVPWGIGT